MILAGIAIILFNVLFEVSFVEINFLHHFCILFVTINLLYWFRQYKLAIFCGVFSSVLIDLILQNDLGRTMLSLFLPLIILDFFNNFLRVEGELSRLIFSTFSITLSIVIYYFLFELVFLRGGLNIGSIISKILVSGSLTFLLGLVFNRLGMGGTKNQFMKPNL